MLDLVLNEFASKLPNYQERNEQVTMVKTIYNGMKRNELGAIEALTGTGKSMAYVLAFIAIKLEDPHYSIVISTYTKRLQDQLNSDIEIAKDIYFKLSGGLSLDTAIVKGKSNYVCRHNYESYKKSSFYTDEFNEKIHNIAMNRKTDVEKLFMDDLGPGISNIIQSSMQVKKCLVDECVYAKDCMYYEHLKKIEVYDIIIVNHHFYLNHSLYSNEGWSSYNYHVFDEAHKLKSTLLDVRTFALSFDQITSWIVEGKILAKKCGVLKDLYMNWATTHMDQKIYKAFKIFFEKLIDLERMLSSRHGGSSTSISYETIGWNQTYLRNMSNELENWQDRARKQLMEMIKCNGTMDLRHDIDFYNMKLLELKEFLELVNDDAASPIFWCTWANNSVELKITPTVEKYLKKPFPECALFTSGTISKFDSCEWFSESLDVELKYDLVLPSPFSLSTKTMVYIDALINPITNDYSKNLTTEIIDLYKRGTGKTFVLFTSETSMKEQYSRIKENESMLTNHFNKSIELLVQSEYSHSVIMDSFNSNNVSSLLFATYSYFEGVDLKGDSLTQVILAKLPFGVPNHPQQEILSKIDGFYEWEAYVRLMQAYGRIMRTKNDYGIFCILDNRVLSNRNSHFLSFFKKQDIPIVTDKQLINSFYSKGHSDN